MLVCGHRSFLLFNALTNGSHGIIPLALAVCPRNFQSAILIAYVPPCINASACSAYIYFFIDSLNVAQTFRIFIVAITTAAVLLQKQSVSVAGRGIVETPS